MAKTKTKEEVSEGQAAIFADRLSEERSKTAFGTPTKRLMDILSEIQKFIDSGSYKKDKMFKEEWTRLHFELQKVFDQANSNQAAASEAKNEKMADSQQELANMAGQCMDNVAKAGGAKENPSTMTQAREQPPQLGQLPGSPRAFTGKTGEEFRTSLPDQFRQGIPPELQEEARLKLQDLLEKKTAKAGKAFYDFLVAHVGPHQLDTMLCGTVTGDGCTQIKKLFQTGKIDALLNGDYPISETLRTTLQNAKTRTRTVVANVTVTADETFKLPNIDNFRLGVHLGGEYQTVVTRTRAGTGPATEEYENLFGGELGPFAELDLGPASKARLGGGVGYGQLEGGLFFPVELKVSSSLGTTEGTALFFDVYGKAKIALDPKDFTQLQGGADAYLILFQLGGNQIGIFTSADVMNVKGKSQELTFNITNLQLDLGPQYQVEVNGVLVAVKMGPVFVFPIQGAGEETTYGLHLGTMFQKNIENGKYEFTGGIDISSGNFFSSRVVTGKQDDLPAFTGTLNLGLKF